MGIEDFLAKRNANKKSSDEVAVEKAVESGATVEAEDEPPPLPAKLPPRKAPKTGLTELLKFLSDGPALVAVSKKATSENLPLYHKASLTSYVKKGAIHLGEEENGLMWVGIPGQELPKGFIPQSLVNPPEADVIDKKALSEAVLENSTLPKKAKKKADLKSSRDAGMQGVLDAYRLLRSHLVAHNLDPEMNGDVDA